MATVPVAVWVAFGGLFALCLGSFTNVVIDRLPLHLSEPNEFGETWSTNGWRHVLGGHSRCSSCEVPIRAVDNVPVLSYLALRGRCRSCDATIPVFHPLVELAVPVAALVVLATAGAHWTVLPFLLAVPALVAIAVIDIRTLIVPTRLVWPMAGVSVAAAVMAVVVTGHPASLWNAVAGVLALAGPLALIWLVLPGAMGFGDVRLATLLGWLVGFATGGSAIVVTVKVMAVCMFLSAVLGIVVGVAFLGARGRKAKVPFGPSMILGALICVCAVQPLTKGFA